MSGPATTSWTCRLPPLLLWVAGVEVKDTDVEGSGENWLSGSDECWLDGSGENWLS